MRVESAYLFCGLSLVLLLGGCATVDVLVEPQEIPSLVKTYEIPGLKEYTGNVPVILDLTECVENAVLSSVGFSGKSSIAGCFPVKELVQREFNKVVSGNFRMALPDEHPKLAIMVASEQIRVERSWSKIKCDMVFSVKIVDPISANRKPYLYKKYPLCAKGEHRKKDEVPVCVYETVQNFARRFLEDIPKEQNGTLITRLKELGVDADE